MKTWNFGVLGLGKIAKRFTDAFQYVPRARVHAVASRDGNKAREFAEAHHISTYYASYEELVSDPAIDIIYIATPHPFHHEQTLLCLHHKKAVLCEKPFAMNTRQVQEMISLGRRSNVFLMEGMWSRFFPSTHKALELVRSGAIGELQYLHADFGFVAPVNLDGRVYNPALGGGAQLDVGVYPMFLALLFLGKPDEIKAICQKTNTGADATTSALLRYSNGAIAHIMSSIVTDTPKEAHLMGTTGVITIHTPWHKSQQVTWRSNAGEKKEFSFPHSGNGFEFEIEEIVRCLDAGKTESELMPHSLSLMMAEVADEILQQGDIRY
ncbi:MAG: Gfo/Idh/MocA family oxidoreductase [Cyclobacteriaceae bacterium]|nr:Gfo/Idh/MocA family oxidoreductase [Cyclobacteriaceae bacterium]